MKNFVLFGAQKYKKISFFADEGKNKFSFWNLNGYATVFSEQLKKQVEFQNSGMPGKLQNLGSTNFKTQISRQTLCLGQNLKKYHTLT